MKIFLSVFFAIVAAGIVLYLINISTIETQLKIADDAAAKFAESKRIEQLKENQKRQEEEKKREEEHNIWLAFVACDRKAKDTLGAAIKAENVVRNTNSFVAFNIADKSGAFAHYRCVVVRQFKVTSFEKH